MCFCKMFYKIEVNRFTIFYKNKGSIGKEI